MTVRRTYVMPMLLHVNKAMRKTSEEPLTEGWPDHLDISSGLLGSRTQPSAAASLATCPPSGSSSFRKSRLVLALVLAELLLLLEMVRLFPLFASAS